MSATEQTQKAKQHLLAQAKALREDISRELRKRDEEHYAALAGEITDRSEESVADLLVDVTLAEISRDVEELRDVEAALARIDRGTWGVCIDCDKQIEADRLEAIPAAARCLDCQTTYEKRDRREHHRTI